MCMRFTLCTPHLLVVQHAKPPPSASIQTNETDEVRMSGPAGEEVGKFLQLQ